VTIEYDNVEGKSYVVEITVGPKRFTVSSVRAVTEPSP